MATPLSTEELFKQVAKEGITDNAGNQLMTGSIAADTLNKAYKAVNLPTFTPPDVPAVVPDTPQTQDKSDSMFKDYLSKLQAPANPMDTYNSLVNETGLEGKQQEVANLTAQLNQITAETKAGELAQKAEGLTQAGATARNITREREAAIRALPIQAQLAAAQGNLQLAQDRVNTAFKIRSDYQTSLFNYNQNLIDKVYQYADKKQQAALEAKKLQQQQAFEAQKINNQQAFEISKLAMNAGQFDIAAQISAIDWSQPDAPQKLTSLQSKIQMSPADKLDLALKQAQLTKLQRETALLGEPTAKQKADEAAKLKTAQGVNEVLQDKLALTDSITSSEKNPITYKMALGKEVRVGPNALSRKSPSLLGIFNPAQWGATIADSTGAGQAFAGAVHRLTSQEFLNKLIEAKAQGATFGALTDREGDALRSAATQINDWEMKDSKGQGLGIWNVSQSDFDREINRIKDLTQKAIQKSQGGLFTSDENAILDSVFSTQDASSFY